MPPPPVQLRHSQADSGLPIWSAWGGFRARVDGFPPESRHVHLRIAGQRPVQPRGMQPPTLCTPPEGEFFIDNLLVRIHCIIEMIWWTGFAPWGFEFIFRQTEGGGRRCCARRSASSPNPTFSHQDSLTQALTPTHKPILKPLTPTDKP